MISFQAKRLQHNSTIVGVCIQGLQTAVETKKSLHIAMVLDTSGSMEGERIKALQKTLYALIDILEPSDALTLITYASLAVRLCTRCSDKTVLRDHVASLHAEGGTNMGSGILELRGLRELDAVFLLTDGQVNQGIRTTTGLTELLRSTVPRTVPVSTVGYGEDHAVDVLQTLAVHTRGSYTFADAAEIIPTIVGNIVGGSRSQITADMQLCKICGTCLELGADKTSPTEYWVGPVIADKPQWIILDLEAGCEDLEAQYTLQNSLHSNRIVIENPLPDAGIQTDIQEQWLRAKAVRLFDRIRRRSVGTMVGIGHLLELEREIDATTAVSGQPLILCVKAQIREMLEVLESPSNQTSHARVTSNYTTMAMQRGVLTRTLPDVHEEMFTSPTQRQVSLAMSQGFSLH